MGYIVALDQGTTSSRAVVMDERGRVVSGHAIEFRQIYPQPGWVEHDPNDILYSQLGALKSAVQKAGIDAKEILAVGVTNQRETTILWERATGRPVCNAIVWQCRRTAPYVEAMKAQGLGETIREKTGLIPDAYFCASKLQWIFDHVPGARERAQRGELLFGTVDTWLTWNLSAGRVHVTDMTNASRTMFFNIHTLSWDEELLKTFGIPKAILPKVVASSQIVGALSAEILGTEIPIAAMAGDQHAALFGQACFAPGMVKSTYGTGGFLLMNTGETPRDSKNGLLTTIAWGANGGKVNYALEGSIFVAGAAIQWLRDELGLIQTAAQTEEIALSIENSGGVYLVPAFAGLGAPHWDMYGRGVIVGLTRGSGRAQIVRAALESIAFQTAEVVRAMEGDSGLRLGQLQVDGGASANNFLMQFQADLLGIAVRRPSVVETTAAGAAYLAGLAVGLWKDQAEIAALREGESFFLPGRDDAWRGRELLRWAKAVERAKGWAEGE
ncbi:MAG: glycerol kinase GlpK [Christensenellaceae bacterium]|jgi:glycerol kinase|nr:glycerol kinase GlpK [Christensenellaceae bacterium]